MKIVRLISLLGLLLLTRSIYAEDNRYGLISTIDVEYELNDRIEITSEWELRTHEYLKLIDRWSSEVSISYKVFDFLKVSNGYSLLRYNHDKRGWETGLRFFIGLTGSYKWNGFKISWSEKFQQTYRRGVPQGKKRDNPKKILKSRLKLKYEIGKTGLSPYVSYELSHDLKRSYKGKIDKTKAQVGLDYDVNERHSVGVFYRLQKERIDEENPDYSALGFSYKLKF
jgi:hypothetical protein